MLNPYNYNFSEPSQSYRFVTNSQIEYYAFFSPFLAFEDPPINTIPFFHFILEARQSTENVNNDTRIGDTVASILYDFFEKNPNSCIYYMCDDKDSRQKSRMRKFDIWFNRYCRDTLHKENGVIVNKNKGWTIYNSVVLLKSNCLFKELISSFSQDLNNPDK